MKKQSSKFGTWIETRPRSPKFGVRISIRAPWLFFLIAGIILACNLPLNLLQETSLLPTPTVARFTIGPTSANSDLGKLKSYRTHLTVDFTGNRNGEVARGHIETSTEVIQQPPALHHYLKVDGQIPKTKIPPGVSEFFRINDRVYLKKAGDNLWSQFTGADTTPDQVGFFDLESLITLPLTVSTPPVTETLDGLSVQHYRFSEADLTHPNIIFDQAQGEVWVASPGGYVVQYVISTSLRIVIPDPKAHLIDQGQLILRYTLTDVDADFTITPPADIPTNNTLNNLPRLPDAEIISVFPDLVEYLSATTPLSATQFYQNELAALEWTEEHASIFQEKARLTFAKDGQILTIMITPVADSQNIKILLDIR
jgi:hypothetical protein